MKIKEMQAQMEAILFANGDPMEVTRLSQVLEVEEGTIEKILNLLARRYEDEESGLCLLRLGDTVQISVLVLSGAKKYGRRWICAGMYRCHRRPWKYWP